MKDSKVKLYPSENVIEDFYKALASKSEKKRGNQVFLIAFHRGSILVQSS